MPLEGHSTRRTSRRHINSWALGGRVCRPSNMEVPSSNAGLNMLDVVRNLAFSKANIEQAIPARPPHARLELWEFEAGIRLVQPRGLCGRFGIGHPQARGPKSC